MARRKKDEGQSPENVNDQNQNSDDTFGLPEIEYRPLNREETTSTSETSSTTSENQTYREMEREEVQNNDYNQNTYYEEDEAGSPWPKILGILAILIIIGGAVWYFGFERPKSLAAAEKARQEREAEEARKREAELAESKRAEDERRRADSLARIATPAAGVIDTLTDRTGRYYVIIASAVDGDLILDYAKKLTPKGLSPKIIPPYGKVKFYRLAIAEGETYTETQATADQLKAEYTDGAWVVKY
jgi:phosphoglycolate phosphatase-like HAD superfamily hydrolase